MGSDGLATVVRIGRLTDEGFDPLLGRGGPVARAHSVAELGLPCRLQPGIPAGANVTSVRNSPPLFGLGQIDTIPDEAILAGASPHADGVQGRPNLVTEPAGATRVGRFGWKADTARLETFVAQAFRNELGITSPLAPTDLQPGSATEAERCAGESATVKDDGTLVAGVTAFVAALAAPPPAAPGSAGEAVFDRIGCGVCHTRSLPASGGEVQLYSDLLLHDMGPLLEDGVVQAQASGRDWRTTPLWGLGSRQRFLHDGQARDIRTAVLTHGGEAQPAVDRFRTLSADDLGALLDFLSTL